MYRSRTDDCPSVTSEFFVDLAIWVALLLGFVLFWRREDLFPHKWRSEEIY